MTNSVTNEAVANRLRGNLVGECNLLEISKAHLLNRKARYQRGYTTRDASTLAAIERGIFIRKFKLAMLRFEHCNEKANFNPAQPRVPAGQREGGQWTATDGGANQSALIVDISSNPEDSETSAGLFGENPDELTPDIQLIGSRSVVTIDYSRALTGISTIDRATKALSETLAQTMSTVHFIPEWTPQIYGTAVHVEFAAQVRALGIPGISSSDVEQSIFNKSIADYGDPGSIRTDVLLRNDIGDIIAIYDIKTGGAVLTAGRVRELRDHTGVGIGVPIIELQVNRGATIKCRTDRRKKIGAVMARVWNPVHLGNAGRVAGA